MAKQLNVGLKVTANTEQAIQQLELLKQCNVLVDGHFELDKKIRGLKFRGSSNQRIIDVQKSLKEGGTILYE